MISRFFESKPDRPHQLTLPRTNMTSPRFGLLNADVVWRDVGMSPSREDEFSHMWGIVSYRHRDFIFKLIQRWQKYTARGIKLSCLPQGTRTYKVSFCL